MRIAFAALMIFLLSTGKFKTYWALATSKAAQPVSNATTTTK